MRVTLVGEGPPVVKLAGIAGGVGLCHEEVGAAVRAGFRIALLDTTGDRGDDPPGGPLSWQGLAGEATRAIDTAGADQAILWGTSFGCLVALATAAIHPDRVSGLLLSHPPHPRQDPGSLRRLYRWAVARPRPHVAVRLLFLAGFYGLVSWEGIFPTFWVRAPRLLRASLDAATPTTTLREKLRLLWETEMPWPASPPPTSIIAGRLDAVAPYADAKRLASELPGAVLRDMPMSGHCGAYHRPRLHRRLSIEELLRLRDAHHATAVPPDSSHTLPRTRPSTTTS